MLPMLRYSSPEVSESLAGLPVAPRARGLVLFRLGVLAVRMVLAPWSRLEAAPIGCGSPREPPTACSSSGL